MKFVDAIRDDTLEYLRQIGIEVEDVKLDYLTEEYIIGCIESAAEPPTEAQADLELAEPPFVPPEPGRRAWTLYYGYNLARIGGFTYFMYNNGPPSWRCLGWRARFANAAVSYAGRFCGNTAVYQVIGTPR